MINFEQAKIKFEEYLEKYNLEYGKIELKIRHTYGVVRSSEYISKDLLLDNEDIKLAKLIALLHDIGRFEQIRRFDSFIDSKTIDHAILGNEILFNDNVIRNFIKNNKYDNIISKAILNHNKFKIQDNLQGKELLHSKIIRDADKTDNFRVKVEDDFPNIIDNSDREDLENGIISDKIYNDFMSNRLIISKDRNTYIDFWVSYIAFIFDFNFDSGLKYIKKMDYINKVINRLNYKNQDTKEKMERIRKHALNYIDKRLK